MMPKPNQSKNNSNYNKSEFKGIGSERVLLETKPNIFLYADNFISKIIMLFLLVLLFAPIITLFYSIQDALLNSFQLNFTNMTFIMELILIFCILIIIIKLILDVLDWNYTNYVLTDQRIVIERGFFRKEKIMMPYGKVQDIEISQTIFERILNVGDIIIYGGHDNSDTILDDTPNPKEVEEIILNQVGNYHQNYASNYHQNNQEHDGYNNQFRDEYYKPNESYNQSRQRYNHNNQIDYNRNNNVDVHYFNNGEDYYEPEDEYNNEEYNPKYDGYKVKWQKNKGNYKKSKINDDEIIKKHQEMFKRHNK